MDFIHQGIKFMTWNFVAGIIAVIQTRLVDQLVRLEQLYFQIIMRAERVILGFDERVILEILIDE